MRHVIAGVDEARAREILSRGWGAKLHGIRAWFLSSESDGPPPRMELIWMPAYLVTISMKTPRGENDLTCFVDGRSGSFALFDMNDAISGDALDAETFATVYDKAEADSIVREELVKVILRRRSRAGKPLPRETKRNELLSYPYWVYYYQRRPGLIDIKVLDAATGRTVGNKIKLAVLDAFKEAAQSHN